MARAGKSLSRRLRDASSLARRVASDVGILECINGIQSMLREMNTERPGVVRVLDSVGVRVVAPWSRDREALVERAPRSFEFAVGDPDDRSASPRRDRHHALHATLVGPGGFAVMFLVRGSRMQARTDVRAHAGEA